MDIGLIGLGRMGAAIAFRLIKAGHKVFGYDPNIETKNELEKLGGTYVAKIEDVPQKARVIWLMVPAGKIVDDVIAQILPSLKPSDIVIDGGNSHFPDSVRRAQELEKKNVIYLDCGTSGGLAGKEIGFSLMIGGIEDAYKKCEPIFKVLAAPQSYGRVGPSGAGHYVKMIHNGIEYALLESYAEGFSLLKQGKYKGIDLAQITGIWQNAAIIRSNILDLSHAIFEKDQEFKTISGKVDETGMGQWTVEEAREQAVPVPLIKEALIVRAWSRKTGGDYATKIIALLRNAFGGHAIEKEK